MSPRKEKKESERFEDHLKSLEEIVRKLESGQLGLDEAMEIYEKGVGALKKCRTLLDAAERKIAKLVREKDGSLTEKPLDGDDNE